LLFVFIVRSDYCGLYQLPLQPASTHIATNKQRLTCTPLVWGKTTQCYTITHVL